MTKRAHPRSRQVSGGAHPRFARNLGTAEYGGVGTTTAPVANHVQHDSRILLPVW
ncbi:hypothetical protein [Allokutzneria oryzae]|uniref:Uncharacterized protein n=1 Tax=Allokutzneria oryzae TaxID=1378989 RepID=A0ABV5ZXG4_9PSEU